MVRLVFRHILKYDERFARQYRYKPPSEFPLDFAFLKHSSPSLGGLTHMLPLKPHTIDWLVVGTHIPTIFFNAQQSLTTQQPTHVVKIRTVSNRIRSPNFRS